MVSVCVHAPSGRSALLYVAGMTFKFLTTVTFKDINHNMELTAAKLLPMAFVFFYDISANFILESNLKMKTEKNNLTLKHGLYQQ